MKREERFKKILIVAMERGYMPEDMKKDFPTLNGVNRHLIDIVKATKADHFIPEMFIYEHDFAKAIWGTRKIGRDFVNKRDIQEWDSHLVKMVLEKDPIAYLEQFISSPTE